MQRIPGPGVITADNHPLGLHEILHRRAFFEEFGVGDHRKVHRPTLGGQPPADGLAHPVGGAHRHRGFIDDDLVILHGRRDAVGHRQHMP